jgi:hypothetical protein
MACAVSWIFLAPAGQDAEAARLVVRVHDTVNVGESEMFAARREVAAILEEAGIEIEWRDCAVGCAEPPALEEVLLRIARAPAGIPPASLGASLVDLEQEAGVLATVYADRIAALAGRARVAPGRLLGRAVAHEIGHLLLGTSRHAASGLMRAVWSEHELRRENAADWTWSSEEVKRLGRARSVQLSAER